MYNYWNYHEQKSYGIWNISDNAWICIDSDQNSSKDTFSSDYKSLKSSSEYNWITSSEKESEKNSIKYIILSYYMFLVYLNIVN